VGHRIQQPDELIAEEVMNELEKNNINASELVEYGIDHCQPAASLIVNILQGILNILGK
jgi:hypothetical protein